MCCIRLYILSFVFTLLFGVLWAKILTNFAMDTPMTVLHGASMTCTTSRRVHGIVYSRNLLLSLRSTSSTVLCPATADSSVLQQWVQTTRYRRSVIMISNDRKMPSHGKTELNWLREANSQWEGIPISNGPRKKWIFKSINTNWQWHKFIFIGGSSMRW